MSRLTKLWTNSSRVVRSRNLCQPLLSRTISNLCMASSDADPPFPLIGPPEIYLNAPHFNLELLTAKGGKKSEPKPVDDPFMDLMAAPVHDPFMDLMVANYNNFGLTSRPGMGRTENNSPTFVSSGNPCVDFFFHVVPDTPSDQITKRLQLAWDQDPLTALKLVCHLRGVRGTGKSDREGFYAAALWLHENHPKTLASNAQAVAEFGYFKDLLEILYRLLEGPDARKDNKAKIERLKAEKGDKWYVGMPKRVTQKERIDAGQKCIERYYKDPVFRFLHNQASIVFAEALRTDLENMKAGNLRNISFAAKWCPSLNSIFDRSTLLCESIARRLFPKGSYPEYQGIEDAHYAYRIRDRLRKEVLVPLRKVLKLPEVYMSANQWDVLPYGRVPSVAMKNYKDLFLQHDGERFQEYLGRVKEGKAKIAAGALLPHEIIASMNYGDSEQVAELQWQRIVDDLKGIGKLRNCLAICDVSGSMHGKPMDVCVALGLLVSELCEEPWKGKVITFSGDPWLHVIEGDTLRSKIGSIVRMHWDMNTDFQKVFDKILEVAKKGNLSEDQMIKRLFVFSDMEFDEARGYWNQGYSWETDYEVICRKFNDHGYKSVPEIVFWNLRDSMSTPVHSRQKGVALVSGFSKNLLKIFLEDGDIANPEKTMELAIAGKEYKKLVVVD